MIRPAWVLGMVLLVLLAMTGVAYGLWAKTLTIQGNVHTGELNAILSIFEIDETDDFNGGSVGNGIWEQLEFEGKDVGVCEAELIDNGSFPDLDNRGPQGMIVRITNAYPSFNCFVVYDIENVGTIPVKIHSAEYSLDGMNWEPAINTPFMHVNGWPPIAEPNDFQLHPGEFTLKSLHFHLNQGAEMDTDYTFFVRNFVHQWNEEGMP